MSMLTGNAIISEMERGRIEIDPFVQENVQPSSLDLRLGTKVKVYSGSVGFVPGFVPDSSPRPINEVLHAIISHGVSSRLVPLPVERLSLYESAPTEEFTIDESGWVLKPGILYLMHTEERLHTKHYATDITGKSSTARIGVQVHLTAGYGDPGFDGQYTLEVCAVHPAILYPGDLICQARFWQLEGAITSYQERGRYVGSRAVGPHAAAANDKKVLAHKTCWEETTASQEVIPWEKEVPAGTRCRLCHELIQGHGVEIPKHIGVREPKA